MVHHRLAACYLSLFSLLLTACASNSTTTQNPYQNNTPVNNQSDRSEPSTPALSSIAHYVSIVQSDEIVLDKIITEVTVKKSPFSIQFYNPLYDEAGPYEYNACKISAFTTSETFNKLAIGMLIDDTEMFGIGKALVTYPGGYFGELYINNQANHFLFHDTDESRVRIVDKKGKYYKQSFDIRSVSYPNSKEVPIEELRRRTLYLAILNDSNHNGFIDEGELHKVILHFSE